MKKEFMLRLDKLKENKGFSLVELLTVMAIIAILVVVGSDMYISYRAKAYDATAMTDGRQLLNAVMNSIVSFDDVDYNHAPEDGNRIGAFDTDGTPRDPILFLSPSTMLRVDTCDNTPGTIFIEAYVYSDGGTKEFPFFVDEAEGISSFSID